MKILIFSTLIFCSLSLVSNSFAQEKSDLQKLYSLFKQGFYADTLEEIDNLKKKFPKSGVLHYWEGLCYKKMQEYEDAHIFFSRARRLGYKNIEMDYEHGQALYALKKLKIALGAFSRSIKKGFKPDQSKLYIAQILEELKLDDKAYKFYDSASRGENDDIAQAAGFKKATMLQQKAVGLQNPKNVILNKVLPKLEQALDRKGDSPLSKAIALEIFKIKNKYGLGPKKLRNGNVVPARDWDLYLAQRFGYDSNVVLEADEVNIESSNKDSMTSFTDINARYRFIQNDLWVFQPEMSVTTERFFERENSEVYTNDNLILNPSLTTKFEHLMGGKPATTSLETAYVYRQQDFNAEKSVDYYFNQTSITLGERVNLLSMGPTQAKVGVEIVRGATDALDTLDRTTYTLSLDQIINLSKGAFLLLLNQNRFNGYKTAETNDTNSYLFRTDYVVPDAIWAWDLNLTAAITITDTKEQSEERGTELLYAPGVFFTKRFKEWRVKLLYNFNSNNSKDKDTFDYTQHIVSGELRYNF